MKVGQRFWERAACGEELFLRSHDGLGFAEHARIRYQIEPYIPKYISYLSGCKRVLEVGVGMGADHMVLSRQCEYVVGVDVTDRALEITKNRFVECDKTSNLVRGDCESLPFSNQFFDGYYSWGVLHHSDSLAAGISELRRVLKDGGKFVVMIYNSRSLVAGFLWVAFGLWRGWSVQKTCSEYLESPGTLVVSKKNAKKLFAWASELTISTELSSGDLLDHSSGARYLDRLPWIRSMIPRSFIRRRCRTFGLFLVISGTKGSSE